MFQKALAIFISTAFAISLAAAAENPLAQTKLSAAEIVDKNVAARGGLQAWRAVQTLSFAGNMGAGGNRRATLPLPMPGPKEILPPSASAEKLPGKTPAPTLVPLRSVSAEPNKVEAALPARGAHGVDQALGFIEPQRGELRPLLRHFVLQSHRCLHGIQPIACAGESLRGPPHGDERPALKLRPPELRKRGGAFRMKRRCVRWSNFS